MARETPEQRVRREQRELMTRLNAERDKKMTTREQNDARMRGAPGRPAAPAVPQGTGPRTPPLGGLAGRAQAAVGTRQRQIDRAVDEAQGKPKNGGGNRGRR